MNKTFDNLTIAVLTRNRSHGLKQTMQSIANLQATTKPKVIVVDDGSDLKHRRVVLKTIENFSTKLNLTYYHHEHRGVSYTRNKAIRKCATKYICILADDYILKKNFGHKFDEVFSLYPDAKVITHNILTCNSGLLSFFTTRIHDLYFQLTLFQQGIPLSHLNDDIIVNYSLPASRAALFDRELFEVVGFFDESLITGEDDDLTRRMSALKIPLYFLSNEYIIHDHRFGLGQTIKKRLIFGKGFGKLKFRNKKYSAADLSFSNVIKAPLNKIKQWRPIAKNRKGLYESFRIFSPVLYLFLFAFFLGCYIELKRSERQLLKAQVKA